MAKKVDVSSDDSTWYTLPGGTGEATNEANAINDTIFGQTFKSSETGLISWMVNAGAYYKGFAGYVAKVLKAGSATAMTGEAMALVSGKTYRITNPVKRIMDANDTFIVLDGVTDVTDEVESYNYLFGEITFLSSYTVVGSITITGDYLPTTALGKANAYTLTQTAEAIETSDFATVQANDGTRTFIPGLRTVALELTGFYDVTSGFRDALKDRDLLILEVNPDGTGKSLARGYFKLSNQSQSGEVGALEEEKVSFSLQVPSSDYLPFSWHHESNTTLHTSIKKVLDAWIGEDLIHVRYLHDGTNGFKGESVVTETTMEGSLDNMNTFTVKFQGSDETTTVGAG